MPNRTPSEGSLKYIIELKSSVESRLGKRNQLLSTHNGALHYQFQKAAEGRLFTAWFLPEEAEKLAKDPGVLSIEPDTGRVHLDAARDLGIDSFKWGLDFVDQRGGAPDSTYNYYPDGSGVHIFVVDTGIDTTHQAFSGRNGLGYTVQSYQPSSVRLR